MTMPTMTVGTSQRWRPSQARTPPGWERGRRRRRRGTRRCRRRDRRPRPLAGGVAGPRGHGVLGRRLVGHRVTAGECAPGQAHGPPLVEQSPAAVLERQRRPFDQHVRHRGHGHAADDGRQQGRGERAGEHREVAGVAVDVEYPLVPQVDAVRQHPEHHHRTASQPTQRAGKRGTCQGDRQDDEEADGRVEALLDHRGAGVAGAHLEAEPQRLGHGPEAGGRRGPAHEGVPAGPLEQAERPGAAARPLQPQREGHAGHEHVEVGGQPVDAGVDGPERHVAGVDRVHPVAERQRAGGGEPEHRQLADQGAARRQPPPSPRGHEGPERQQQVEGDLVGQRPGLLQPAEGRIGRVALQQAVVHHVVPQPLDLVASPDVQHDDEHGQGQPVGGVDAQRPIAQVGAGVEPGLPSEPAGHEGPVQQEARQDEEDGHADVEPGQVVAGDVAGGEAHLEADVRHEHAEGGERPQAVEPGEPAAGRPQAAGRVGRSVLGRAPGVGAALAAIDLVAGLGGRRVGDRGRADGASLGVPRVPPAAGTPESGVEGHGGRHHQRQLGGQPEPRVAVHQRHDHDHAAHHGHDREDRPPGPAQPDQADAARHGDAVPDHHADLAEHDLLLVDRRVEQQLLLRLVQAEGPPDPGCHHVRHPVAVLAGVVEGDLAEAPALHRGVALGHQVLGLLDAGQRPVADPVALVDRLAVGGADGLVELGRQRGRLLEAGQVVPDPRGDDDDRRQACRAQLGRPPHPPAARADRRLGASAAGAPAPPHDGDGEQGAQQDRLGPHEGGDADHHAEGERAAQRRPVPPAVRRPQDRGGGGDHHRLGHHHGVEVEDVGAEGGEHGHDQPDPLAGDAAPGDAHGGDAGGADQARDDLVLEERPEAQPGEAGQHGHEAGRVVRARHAHAEEQELVRVHVPLAVGEQVGALVVVVRIADDRPRAAPTHEVDEAHGEAGGGDAGEPPPEPADARGAPSGAGRAARSASGPAGPASASRDDGTVSGVVAVLVIGWCRAAPPAVVAEAFSPSGRPGNLSSDRLTADGSHPRGVAARAVTDAARGNGG